MEQKKIQLRSFCVLCVQVLAVLKVADFVFTQRELVLNRWHNFLLKLFLSLTLSIATSKDLYSISIHSAMIESGSIGLNNKLNKIINFIRFGINGIALPTLIWFIFSTDLDHTYNIMNVVMDFTSLMVLLDIDNMVAFDINVKGFDA